MVKKTNKISDSEWEVMEVLWDDSPIPSSAIIERLQPQTDWKPKTIHTLISRLVKKGVVGVEKNTTRYLYYPLLSKEECRLTETETFLEKVYNGSVSMLVANFIKQDRLSQQEINELKKLLDDDTEGEAREDNSKDQNGHVVYEGHDDCKGADRHDECEGHKGHDELGGN
ncbi:BlaI/MecI/CopY family transcriptional regulator [Natranaerobius thermophilus]|uniref:Transcriptional repressor, CopY family n=1 Tax=Natranaerobius thermophilus (strain ATCC BAA-1301 / DSM 18059 / JW/NM-WN-LF) TaxID=457570 RepID=B2A1U7_NATTJ|nr:BlaI/MecI/CopY family transcriptional regulator [Natranaerobius thermophilus]ACB86144.1 transcriptional repressor, CopY family [Natranaerobius thermophilus JW/NM-WN-LF]